MNGILGKWKLQLRKFTCVFYRGKWQGCWPLRYSHRKRITELTQVKEWTQKIQGKEWFPKNLSCMLQILFHSKMELYLCAFLIIDTSHFKVFHLFTNSHLKIKTRLLSCNWSPFLALIRVKSQQILSGIALKIWMDTVRLHIKWLWNLYKTIEILNQYLILKKRCKSNPPH